MEPDNSPKCNRDQNNETELIIGSSSKTETQNTSSEDAPNDVISLILQNPFHIESNNNILKSVDTINNESEAFAKINERSQIIYEPTSTLMTPRSAVLNQPQSLFIQALSQLDERSFNYALINRLKTFAVQQQNNTTKIVHTGLKSGEATPPDSLTSAPPSYSFVLRQMTAQHRPRLMGTFIPSPSFIQHTPPPNYATAFDIYVDNPIPPPPSRVYNFSFASMPVICPECGYAGMTTIISKITMCTHFCAFILCILFCWICVPLPYILRSCKNVYHYCGNCRFFLGMYCPTSPDNSYR